MSIITGGYRGGRTAAPAESGRSRVAVLGAHGGSATSTVARSLSLREIADRTDCGRLCVVVVTVRSTTWGVE